MRSPVFVALAFLVLGCESNGVSYGLYVAEGTLTESCGDTGLLAAPEELTLRVHLRRVGQSALHWNHGDGLIIGDVDTDNGFRLAHLDRVDMRNGDTTLPPCSVEHRLTINGAMWGPAGDVEGFEATMSHAYAPIEGSACDDLLEGPERIADALPCTVSYDVEGAREE